jgi:hypothetical protein
MRTQMCRDIQGKGAPRAPLGEAEASDRQSRVAATGEAGDRAGERRTVWQAAGGGCGRGRKEGRKARMASLWCVWRRTATDKHVAEQDVPEDDAPEKLRGDLHCPRA